MAHTWSAILIQSRNFSHVPTITFWRKKGVVAQTISSYGLHKDYHQPSDDIAHIDFQHMDDAIGSLLEPVEWLVNSDFKPRWNKGGQP